MEQKQITYKMIYAEGFQSLINPVSFALDQVGLNLVQGDNGQGKSTLFTRALVWAEYGENPNDTVATWVDKRPDTFRGTRVIVDKTDGEYDYRTVRHLDFKGTTLGIKGDSSLMVFVKPAGEEKFTKDHQVGSGQHKSDAQKLINDQLGIDYNTFKNSIIFGQKMASLVEAENKDKRDLFEALFDVGFVDFAKSNADRELKTAESTIAVLDNSLTSLDDNIRTVTDSIEKAETADKEFYAQKESRVATARAEVDKYTKHLKEEKEANELDEKTLGALTTKELEKAQKVKKDLETKKELLQTGRKELTASKDAHANSLRTANANLIKYQQELAEVKDKCPSCGSPVKAADLTKVKATIKAKVTAEENVIRTLGTFDTKLLDANTTEQEKCTKDIEKATQDLAKFDNLVSEKATLTANIANRVKNIETYNKFLTTANTNLEAERAAEKPANDIKALKEKLEGYEESKITKGEELSAAKVKKEHTDWWIKKGFGAVGIKAFVFNAMLTQLNHYSYKYAAKLGFRIEFSIDMSKASKPFQTLIYSGEHIRNYKDLSGGQKQRVNACLAFAMHDLISRDVSFNLFVVDEMTEGLDRDGNEVFFEFIRMKAEDKSVYVISHLDIIDTVNARIINVSSVDGNTIIS